ncbi:MAG: serine hydrolase, partial [Cyclobacteriaceae bacterium]
LVYSQSSAQSLPIKTGEEPVPLRTLLNDDLQLKLEEVIQSKAKWKSLVAKKKMAVGLVDLSDPNNIRFARVNGDEMMYAASLPKIAVLLASMDAIDKGELKETEEIRKDMKAMIHKSNNQATTRMIDRVGFKKIEEIVTNERYHLYEEDNGGGLWVGKRYASSAATKRDPLKNLSHAATVAQVCRFYYLLYQGKLVNEKRSAQMLDIMVDSGLHHKFINTLDRIAPNAKVYRKSGSWRNYHSDSVLVWGSPQRRYILVALIEDDSGEQIMRNLIVPVEKILNAK